MGWHDCRLQDRFTDTISEAKMFTAAAIVYKDDNTCILAEDRYEPSQTYSILQRPDGSYTLWNTAVRDLVGARLYEAVDVNLRTAAEQGALALVGFDHPAINASKLTGMILDAAGLAGVEAALADPAELADWMMKACDVLVAIQPR